jgi:hypothetical protein
MGNMGTTLGAQTFGDVDYVNSGITTIASAATISPIGNMARITGNTTINTINLPCPGFIGPLMLVNSDSSVGTIGTSGNVALGVTLTRYKLFLFIYDPTAAKWYPSNAS